jgi:predicted phosphodiesterase
MDESIETVFESPVDIDTTDSLITPEIAAPTLIQPGSDYFATEYPESQTSFIIPLTVRHAGDDRAVLFFELDQPSEGKLVYRSLIPGSSARGEFSLNPVETRHKIELEGLNPGGNYAAKVLLGNENDGYSEPRFGVETWGYVEFKTIAAGEPLRVGVIGDASFGDLATKELVELMAEYDLDFVINTGDVVYEANSADLYSSYSEKFFQPFKPLLKNGPVYTVMGNHDYDQAVMFQDAPFYDHAFPAFDDPAYEYPQERRGNQFYGLAFGDLQFLMLDSQAIFGAGGREVQDAWLEERLADPRFRLTIPVFHVSPYSSSIVHPDDGDPVRLSWNYQFEAASVPLVLSGHFHHYERLSANGITYVVSGGGSSTLYAQGSSLPESQIFIPRTHFVLLEAYPDRIELSAIAKEGDPFDRATITFE